jgi:hypothetical protein
MNPLAEGDRLQAFRLLQRALPRIMAEPDNAQLRIELCAAALLENRAADDGADRRRERDETSRKAYALATALHIRYHHVRQGEATSAVMPTVTRLTPPEDVESAGRIAEALGVWRAGMAAADAAAASADALERLYRTIGMPTHVRDLAIPRADLPMVACDTLKNFNANPGERSPAHVDAMLQLLEAAWSAGRSWLAAGVPAMPAVHQPPGKFGLAQLRGEEPDPAGRASGVQRWGTRHTHLPSVGARRCGRCAGDAYVVSHHPIAGHSDGDGRMCRHPAPCALSQCASPASRAAAG